MFKTIESVKKSIYKKDKAQKLTQVNSTFSSALIGWLGGD